MRAGPATLESVEGHDDRGPFRKLAEHIPERAADAPDGDHVFV